MGDLSWIGWYSPPPISAHKSHGWGPPGKAQSQYPPVCVGVGVGHVRLGYDTNQLMRELGLGGDFEGDCGLTLQDCHISCFAQGLR